MRYTRIIEVSPKKISEILNENVNNIRNWKNNDKWDEQLREDTMRST